MSADDKVVTKFQLIERHPDLFCLVPWIIGQPEGSRQEWLSVLECIKAGTACRFKRVEAIPVYSACGLGSHTGNIRWSNPRNSNGSAVEMPKDQISQFIAQASKLLKKEAL